MEEAYKERIVMSVFDTVKDLNRLCEKYNLELTDLQASGYDTKDRLERTNKLTRKLNTINRWLAAYKKVYQPSPSGAVLKPVMGGNNDAS